MGMVAEVGGVKCFPAIWSVRAKPCNYCKSAGAVLFCRTFSTFMCMGCDANVHGGGLSSRSSRMESRHEHVWMCEVCEQAPASVTCKADAAALCVTCDWDIHSANPLSRRHDRTPVVPFSDASESIVKSTPSPAANHNCKVELGSDWISPDAPITSKATADAQGIKSLDFLFSDTDQLIDFDYSMSVDTRLHSHGSVGTDIVVPIQAIKPSATMGMIDYSTEDRFEIDFIRSNLNSYSTNYSNASLSHSVSSSSLDVGVVPDGSSMSEISYPLGRNVNAGAEVGRNQASQLVGMDREARVMRYREKRKNRKFEKMIRYASRKAYAETRPRIKGRFAKRADIDVEVDQLFGSAFMADAGSYGVVPTF